MGFMILVSYIQGIASKSKLYTIAVPGLLHPLVAERKTCARNVARRMARQRRLMVQYVW